MQHHSVQLDELKMHYVVAGDGPTIMLLHGWPQTWYAWRHVIQRLSMNYQVIAPDMRGLGDSSCPNNGYDVQSLAGDILALAEQLQIGSMAIVGHDLGGPVAYTAAAMAPELVTHLGVVDAAIPGIPVEGFKAFMQQFWHISFHQSCDITEDLIRGRERLYLEYFFRSFAYDKSSITRDDVEEYVRCYKRPGALRAGFSFYRAHGTNTEQISKLSSRKLSIPVIAYGGAVSLRDWPLKLLAEVAQDVDGGVVDNCGHWIAEERPEWLATEISRLVCS